MVAYQIVHFRRSTGDERQQLKWFLAGGALAVGGLIIATQSNTLGFMFVFIVALPLGIGFGILKYRLYDIDRLISRTISYAIADRAARRRLRRRRAAHDRTCCRSRRRSASQRRRSPRPRCSTRCGCGCSGSSTAASTAPATTPRRRSRRSALRLRDAVDVETVLGELAAAVAGAVEPAHVTVWVRAAP